MNQIIITEQNLRQLSEEGSCIPVTAIHKICLMNTWINMSAFKQIFASFGTSSFSYHAFFFFRRIAETISF